MAHAFGQRDLFQNGTSNDIFSARKNSMNGARQRKAATTAVIYGNLSFVQFTNAVEKPKSVEKQIRDLAHSAWQDLREFTMLLL